MTTETELLILGLKVANKNLGLDLFQGFKRMGALKRIIVKKTVRDFLIDSGLSRSKTDDLIAEFFKAVDEGIK